jgi:hypothetical protein
MLLSLYSSGVGTLFNPVIAHRVAELGVTKLSGTDALLLFLYPPAALHRDPQRPLQHFVGDWSIRVWRHQLDESADGILDARRVATAQGATQVNAPLVGKGSAGSGAAIDSSIRTGSR